MLFFIQSDRILEVVCNSSSFVIGIFNDSKYAYNIFFSTELLNISVLSLRSPKGDNLNKIAMTKVPKQYLKDAYISKRGVKLQN